MSIDMSDEPYVRLGNVGFTIYGSQVTDDQKLVLFQEWAEAQCARNFDALCYLLQNVFQLQRLTKLNGQWHYFDEPVLGLDIHTQNMTQVIFVPLPAQKDEAPT